MKQRFCITQRPSFNVIKPKFNRHILSKRSILIFTQPAYHTTLLMLASHEHGKLIIKVFECTRGEITTDSKSTWPYSTSCLYHTPTISSWDLQCQISKHIHSKWKYKGKHKSNKINGNEFYVNLHYQSMF